MNDSSSGPAFDEDIDGPRIRRQIDVIRDYMLSADRYMTLAEISSALQYPEASISADLRHLRKEAHGSYDVPKRRREENKGTWEYKVRPLLLVQAGLPY